MKPSPVIALTLAIAGGCGDPDPGELTVAIYGEEFIEVGIPAGELVDGWAIRFDRFLVSVGDVTAAAGDQEPALATAEHAIVDLARPSAGQGHALVTGEVPGGTYDRVGYRIAAAAAPRSLNVTPADVELMTGNELAVFVEGTASRGDQTLSFAWGFPGATRYGDCEGTAAIDGAPARTELTIHGDHLFYDDLVSSTPEVAFDLIAGADADGDGAISEAELRAIDITGEERYQTGNLEIEDLWTFIDHQVSTLGHIDGEGHCPIAARE